MGIISMSLASSVLILVILVIRILLMNRLPKKTFMVLWGIALCRLLIPLSVPSKLNIFALLHLNNSKVIGTTALVIPSKGVKAVPDMGNPIFTDSSATGISTITLFWLMGLIVCTLYILVTHLRCCKEYKTALPIDNEFIKCWLKEHKLRRTIQIKQYDRIAAPLTYGIFKPVILLPKTTNWDEHKRLQYVLTHEYTHIKKFDTLSKLLLASALCVHWFNPLVWVMYTLANRDIERSCDESVIRTYGETEKCSYAMSLIELEEKRSGLTPLCTNFSKNSTQERIVSIMKMKKNSLLGIVLAITVVIGTTAAFATSASTEDKSTNNNKPANVSTQDKSVNNDKLTNTPAEEKSVNNDKLTNTSAEDKPLINNKTVSETKKFDLADLEIDRHSITYDEFKAWLEKCKGYLEGEVASGISKQKDMDKAMEYWYKLLESIKDGKWVDVQAGPEVGIWIYSEHIEESQN